MTIYFREQGTTIVVYGNTYAVRERLKSLGARFNGQEKNWLVPRSEDNLKLVEGIVEAYGGKKIGAVGVFGTSIELTEGVTTVLAPVIASGSPVPLGSLVETPTGSANDLSIRQLMDKVGFAVTHAFPRSVWVVGEIQNLAMRPSGIFFDLAESSESGHQNATVTVRSILWSQAQTYIRSRRGEGVLLEVLQEGLKVRALCTVQLYKDRGQVSLLIEDIDPSFTKGALALAREKLLKELRAKGLDEAQQKLPLPPFPFRVGLISAEGSRAASDFTDQLQEIGFPGEILFCSAPMQGEAVPVKVVKAIEALAAQGVDLIVLTRGGGSAADLRWFDAPEIAYAIARCKIPVVAAIGHHDDVCVAELVCHLRQKTPTAAADFVGGIFRTTRQRLDQHAGAMAQQLTRRANDFAAMQAQLAARLTAAAGEAIARREQRLQMFSHRLATTATELVTLGLQRLEALRNRMAVLSTETVAREARRLALAQSRMAQLAVETVTRGTRRLDEAGSRIAQLASEFVARGTRRTDEQRSRLAQIASERVGREARHLDELQARSALYVERSMATRYTRVGELERALVGHDPKPWLAQGWTQLCDGKRVVRSVLTLRIGTRLSARLLDGRVTVEVSSLTPDQGSEP